MASQKFFAAFAAFSLLIGSEASPCRPVPTTSEIATTPTATSLLIETDSTTIETADATQTTAVTSLETSSVTEITITESETTSTGAVITTKTTSADGTTTETTISTTEATSTTTSAASPTLLITNGDFETGNNVPWTYSGTAANAFVDNSRSNTGVYSFGMVSAASDWVTVVQTLDKSLLIADSPYKLSLYANVEAATKCSSGVTMFIDNNNLQSPFGSVITVGGADLENSFSYVWGLYTFTQDALDGDSPIRVVIKTRCGNGYTAWVDTVELAPQNK